jgi:very-long-chain enoyl-CoA reductase
LSFIYLFNRWSTSKLDFDIGRLATAGVAVFAIGEIGNFYYHYYMSNLRSSGKKGNFLPKGGMFNYVVAPHYFFELLTWLGWNMVLGFKDIPSAVFWFASLLTMGLRAKQKHASYVEQFDGKDGRPLFNKNTKFIIPFLW